MSSPSTLNNDVPNLARLLIGTVREFAEQQSRTHRARASREIWSGERLRTLALDVGKGRLFMLPHGTADLQSVASRAGCRSPQPLSLQLNHPPDLTGPRSRPRFERIDEHDPAFAAPIAKMRARGSGFFGLRSRSSGVAGALSRLYRDPGFDEAAGSENTRCACRPTMEVIAGGRDRVTGDAFATGTWD